MNILRRSIAEFLGTFVLVTFGCGTAIATGDTVATAMAFGLSIVAMAYSIGSISGCHINPAVSLAMAMNRKITWKDFMFYVLAQILGGFLAIAALRLMFGPNCTYGANACTDVITKSNDIKTYIVGLGVEIMLTAVFVFAILGVTRTSEYRRWSGLIIGFTLTLIHLLGIGLTGTSVNPARSIAPAIFAGGKYLEQIWIFIVGPLIGAALASFIWDFIDQSEE